MMKEELIWEAVINLCFRALFWELASKEEKKKINMRVTGGKLLASMRPKVNIIHEKVGLWNTDQSIFPHMYRRLGGQRTKV